MKNPFNSKGKKVNQKNKSTIKIIMNEFLVQNSNNNHNNNNIIIVIFFYFLYS